MISKILILFVSVVFVFGCGDGNVNADAPPVCSKSNCHGAEVECDILFQGDLICTQEYRIGDHCRELASCQMQDDKCSLIESQEYLSCKACVKKCEGLDGEASLRCDDSCRKR